VREEADLAMSLWKHKLCNSISLARWVARLGRPQCSGSVAGYPHLNTFITLSPLHDEVCGGTAIDFLEFGVCTGHSIRFWSQINRDPQSRFIGFDSFEGLPEDWTRNYPKGSLDVGGAVPQIDDERVSFVKGWFQNTLPGFLNGFTPRSRLVVHSDSDLVFLDPFHSGQSRQAAASRSGGHFG
jgi:hypothetical protein